MFTRCIGVIECGYMSDTSINNINDNEVDALSEYFEVESGDVYYTFKGKIASSLSGGINNPLYGKHVNLNVLYNTMMDDVVKYVQYGEYWKDDDINERHTLKAVRKYTSEKYGVTIDWIRNRINGFDGDRRMTTDDLYKLMIDHVGGLYKIDWLSLYKKMSIHTDNNVIIEYIAKEIMKDSIYKYFVDRYNLRVDRITDRDGSKYVALKWGDDREKLVLLSELVYNKRDWWKYSTLNKIRRHHIIDYDMLLNGRSEDEVLPDRCPIDTNIVMNYTRIDFSENNNKNINMCKKLNDNDIDWSFASIDRIDSTKAYDYDNIEIISQYYNSQVKNCANELQIGKLYYYQLHRLLGSKINKDGIKTMSDGELDKIFDNLGVYVNIIEIVHEYRKILFKELNKRDKKRSKLQLVDPGEIG